MGSGGDYSKGTTFAQTPTPTTGDCSSLECHNSVEKPANDRTWPTVLAISCNDCHLSTVDDVDDYEFRQFTTASVPRLLESEWTTTGHGRLTASGDYPQSGNPAANMDCPDCHDAAVPHGDPVIPYKTNGTGDQDIFCLNCHGDAATRGSLFAQISATTRNIRTHSYEVFSSVGYGAIEPSWRVRTFKCIDCHDPHGDSANVMMIHSSGCMFRMFEACFMAFIRSRFRSSALVESR